MIATASPAGVLVVDKPRGPTSHDVVMRIRRALATRAAGHAGTLDPMATGVLVVAVGEATKLVPWLTSQDKTYEATIALGVETDTLDAEGRPVREAPVDPLLMAELLHPPDGPPGPLLRAALEAEAGRTLQVPPAVSAIRTDGERAYARARRGEVPELAPRPVCVKDLTLVGSTGNPPAVLVRVQASKGYYVRSLARDLAGALGTVGHLTELRRTRSGAFAADEAMALDAAPPELLAALVPLAVAARRALPVAILTETGARDARHGRAVAPHDLAAETGRAGPTAWLDPEGRLVAVGDVGEDCCGRVLRGFGEA